MAWQSGLPLVVVVAALLKVTSFSQGSSGDAFYAAIRANDLSRLDGLWSRTWHARRAASALTLALDEPSGI